MRCDIVQPKGCKLPFPSEGKQQSKTREAFGKSASLPVTTGFLLQFARKTALEWYERCKIQREYITISLKFCILSNFTFYR